MLLPKWLLVWIVVCLTIITLALVYVAVLYAFPPTVEGIFECPFGVDSFGNCFPGSVD